MSAMAEQSRITFTDAGMPNFLYAMRELTPGRRAAEKFSGRKTAGETPWECQENTTLAGGSPACSVFTGNRLRGTGRMSVFSSLAQYANFYQSFSDRKQQDHGGTRARESSFFLKVRIDCTRCLFRNIFRRP
jgi:hypothetical protein